MKKEDLVQLLVGLAMPLGPHETFEEREERRAKWSSLVSSESMDALIELLRHPVLAESIYPVTAGEFEFEVTESLIMVGKHEPDALVTRLKPLLNEASLRGPLIEVLGGVSADYSIDLLASLLKNKATNLNEGELIRLAGALGELGGVAARGMLEQLRDSHAGCNGLLKREIEIAIGNQKQ